jgi:hypothetical protein
MNTQIKWSSFLMGLSLSAAYILGCATGEAVSNAGTQEPVAAAAEAPAVAPSGAQRWAYQCTEGRNTRTINDRANTLGAEGWEMVGAGVAGVGIWCFKRPV